jgi:hypothetical protein
MRRDAQACWQTSTAHTPVGSRAAQAVAATVNQLRKERAQHAASRTAYQAATVAAKQQAAAAAWRDELQGQVHTLQAQLAQQTNLAQV